VPLSATGVNLAGKPAKLGGAVAAVAGWIVLAVTLAIALLVGAVLQAVFAGAFVGWAVGLVITAIGGAAAAALLMGGKFLRKTGDEASLGAKREAVFAMAQNQKGILRVPMVAKSLGLTPLETEAFLTELARDPESGMTLEVDADGKIYYRFLELATDGPWPPSTLGAATGASTVVDGVRVGESRAHARTETAPAARPRVTTSLGVQPVEDEPPESEAGDNGTKRARQLR
jgi:hypothetical protein